MKKKILFLLCVLFFLPFGFVKAGYDLNYSQDRPDLVISPDIVDKFADQNMTDAIKEKLSTVDYYGLLNVAFNQNAQDLANDKYSQKDFSYTISNLTNGKKIGSGFFSTSASCCTIYNSGVDFVEVMGKVGEEFVDGVNKIEACVNSESIKPEYDSNNNCVTIDITVHKRASTVVAPKIDQNFSKHLAGRLLLDVQNGGAIWYVDQNKYQRHLVTWDNALPLFQKFALGITDADLLKIPADLSAVKAELDSDHDGYTDVIELQNNYSPYLVGGSKFKTDKNFAAKLKGKFLLQVNQQGVIWYVAQNGMRYNIHWNNLMDVFTKLALGISNSDIQKIEVAND